MMGVKRLTDRLEKPEVDDRSYRVIQLPNKLEALLVHDPDTDKASASVNVNVGNFSDEDSLAGCAHAVEHLLFMGTEKYPVENAYNQYLAAHSGSSNAYTGSIETNYFFEVAATTEESSSDGQLTPGVEAITNGSLNGHITGQMKEESENGTSANGYSSTPLYGALDRFAQFFIAPLFLESTVDRELRAVDSENKKNLQSDLWRLMQLNKSLSNPRHPYHHFSTGNLQTLRDDPLKRGVEIRSEFIKFYKKHYSANRMKLVVLGRESLDQLEEWVAELFSKIENKDLPQNRWDDVQPFSSENLCTEIFAKPVMDTRALDIYFPFTDEEHLYESHPSRYISHLIGHEGPGSILAYVKEKGWANSLSAGVMPLCPGSAFFTISVRLTEDGLKEYREVVKVIFQYIAMIKERQPEKWIFDEAKTLNDVEFRFRQKTPASRFTSRISSVMQKPIPREWLLNGTNLLKKFDPAAIEEALSYLRADNFRLMIISQNYPGNWESREKWYGTEYKVEKIPENFLSDIQRALASSPESRIPELHLPHRNEFIPTRLSVEKKDVPLPAKAPKLIRLDDQVRVWFKKDDRFWVPKATLHVTFRNPLVWATPANHVKAKLYCELVSDSLMEYSYDAEIAGLDYDLSASIFGLDVSVGGYNDKMAVLLDKVMTTMRDLEIRPNRFTIIKERLARAYRNAEYQQPYYQVGDLTRYLTAEKTWINEQFAAELEHIEAEDVATFFPQILKHTHIEVLAHGNIYKEDALKMTNAIESIIRSRPLPQSQWHVRRNVILPPGSNYVYEKMLKDPENVNHCIEYYLFLGGITDNVLRSKLLLFAQMTEEPAFDQLRSKEQLGYVVWSGARYSSTTIGYRVIIQSERTTEYLESRIDSFLQNFGETLESMTSEEFEGHKRSIINKRLEKLKNLGSETSRYWSHIGSEYLDFLQHETDALTLRSLTKADIIEFYRQFIDPSSPLRAKLSIHLMAKNIDATSDAVTVPEDQKSQLSAALERCFDNEGVAVDPDRLATALEQLDLGSGNVDEIIATLKDILVTDLQLPAHQIQPFLAQSKDVLESFGVHASEATAEPEKYSSVNTNGSANGSAIRKRRPVFITNVPSFKARHSMSAGPAPLTDLSEFEDFDSKL